jgi:predicted RNA binding protein YcfA (HicA-like mRNA interferase family)
MIIARDMKQAVARAQADGWAIEKTSGNHIRLRHPDAAKTVTATWNHPKDSRAVANFQALLRRALREGTSSDASPAPAKPAPKRGRPVSRDPKPAERMAHIPPPEPIVILRQAFDNVTAQLADERKLTATLQRELQAFESLRVAVTRIVADDPSIIPAKRPGRKPKVAKQAEPVVFRPRPVAHRMNGAAS